MKALACITPVMLATGAVVECGLRDGHTCPHSGPVAAPRPLPAAPEPDLLEQISEWEHQWREQAETEGWGT